MTFKPLIKPLLALSAVVLHTQAGAYCFTLIGPDNRTLYQSINAPFDLSRPFSQTLASRYPGHHLVMATDSANCGEIDNRLSASSAAGGPKSVEESAIFRNAREVGDLTEAEARDGQGLPAISRSTRGSGNTLRLRTPR
ncbi:MAG: hypothetical protein QM750_28530 [Rubrivivax sp.]